MITLERPQPGEYFDYFDKYIRLVEGDALVALQHQHVETQALLARIGEGKAGHRYAIDKWSVRETIGHLADVERILAYRALRFARGDRTELPGFDENAYVPPAKFDARTLASVAAEYAAVRVASLAMFRTFDDEAMLRTGIANGKPMSVRALIYTIAGHELHHLQILRERYGLS